MQIPDGYKGREQAFVKHQLLKGYLEHLFMIVGHRRARCISFIDCFAGPWQDESETLGTTSIAISLEIMRRCRDAYTKNGWGVPTFRALFIEKNRTRFKRLQAFLSTPREGIETAALHGDFIEVERNILDWCGQDDFAFFFIDPKGWKDVSMPKLRPLLERPNSEFLINLMYDFVNRAASQAKFTEEMRELFGGDVARIVDLSASSKEREWELVRLYQQHLKVAVPTSRAQALTSAVPILDPHRDRTKYYLVYLTRHPKGILEFVQQSEKVEIVQPHVRAQAQRNRRVERTGQYAMDLAGLDSGTGGAPLQVPMHVVKEYWLRKVTKQPRQFGLMQFALMHEETGWFHCTLQAGLRELITDGMVRNLDAQRRRTKNYVDFEKDERLVRL